MILLRDTQSRGGTRIPAWLDGCPNLQRIATDRGDILTAGDPIVFHEPAERAWRDLGEGWQCAQSGPDPEHYRHLRRRTDIETVPVQDRTGRDWLAPIILDSDGEVALTLPWGRVNGVIGRNPTEEQSRLILAAHSARKEILGSGLGNLPIAVGFEWVGILLESIYYLSADVLLALELIDDTLGAWVLLTAAAAPRRANAS